MKINELITLLDNYSFIMDKLGSKKSEIRHIEKLKNILNPIQDKDLDFLKNIINNSNSKDSLSTKKVDFNEFINLYEQKKILNVSLKMESEERYNSFIEKNSKIKEIMMCSSAELEEIVNSEKIHSFTVNEIKFISKKLFNRDISSIKLKSEMINILRRQSHQQNYFENITEMYNYTTKK